MKLSISNKLRFELSELIDIALHLTRKNYIVEALIGLEHINQSQIMQITRKRNLTKFLD